MKKYLIVLLVLVVVAFAHAQAFAQTEIEIRDEAITRLRQIYQGQTAYLSDEANFYPPPGGGCPNNVCWQGQTLSSLITHGSSSEDLISVLKDASGNHCPQTLSVNTGGNGDVRFRCRRQGADRGDVWCFAYRCEQASPAGCKQLWRLRFQPREDSQETPLNCFELPTGVMVDPVCPSAPGAITRWSDSCL